MPMRMGDKKGVEILALGCEERKKRRGEKEREEVGKRGEIEGREKEGNEGRKKGRQRERVEEGKIEKELLDEEMGEKISLKNRNK